MVGWILEIDSPFTSHIVGKTRKTNITEDKRQLV